MAKRKKKAYIVVDLRTGEHVAHVPDLIAVLKAAGWKTKIALKEYSGETLKLGEKAAKKGYDMVISYGGDGTLNGVVNGVMYARGRCLIGDIPGGTYNEWANTISVPEEPVKAALTIVDSEAHRVDLGRVMAASLVMHNGAEGEQRLTADKNTRKKLKKSSRSRTYFLLHVGMGIDAAIMAHIDKPLKYHVGRLAFDIAAVKELPELHPFPIEVLVLNEDGEVSTHWHGEAWQVIVSKTRYYAGVVDVAPQALLDDGLLNVCVITANGAVKTVEQALSLLLSRKPDNTTTQYFRGAHLSINVPASIGLQIDGSVAKPEDYLSRMEQETLKQVGNREQVMVSYRFDAQPGAVNMAVPRASDRSLFKASSHQQMQATALPLQQREGQPVTAQHNGRVSVADFLRKKVVGRLKGKRTRGVQRGQQQPAQPETQQGIRVSVIGVVRHPEEEQTYILAGLHKKRLTDENDVVAIRIDGRTRILGSADQPLMPQAVLSLQEGEEIVVEGKRDKWSVMQASCIRLSQRAVTP